MATTFKTAAESRTILNVEDGAEVNVVTSVHGRTGAVITAAADITDSTATGRGVLTAASGVAARDEISLFAVTKNAGLIQLRDVVTGATVRDIEANLATEVGALVPVERNTWLILQIPTAADGSAFTLKVPAATGVALPLVKRDTTTPAAGDWGANNRLLIYGAGVSGLEEWRIYGLLPSDLNLAGKAAVSHTHLAAAISDSTVIGRTLLTAADAAAARTALVLGTLATKSVALKSDVTDLVADLDALDDRDDRIESTVISPWVAWSTGVGYALITADVNDDFTITFPVLRTQRFNMAAVISVNPSIANTVSFALPKDSEQRHYTIRKSDGAPGFTTSLATAMDSETFFYLGLGTQGHFVNVAGIPVRDMRVEAEIVEAETAARIAADATLTTGLAAAERYHHIDRPGDAPHAFSLTATGTPAAKGGLSAANNKVVDGLGNAYEIVGSANVHTREPILLTGRVVEIEAQFARTQNTDDPSGAAVRLSAVWLDKNKAAVGSVSVLTTVTNPTVEQGPMVVSGRVSALAVSGVTVPPAGAVYVIPRFVTFSADTKTALGALVARDVTDLHALSTADLSAVIAAATAATNAATNAAAGVSRVTLDSYTALRAYTPGVGVGEVALRHGSAANDGLGGVFCRDAADTSTADDGANVILDAVSPTAGRWKRVYARVGLGFSRLPTRERIRTLEQRFGSVVDVQDFNGVDPTGDSSSLAGIAAAVAQWKLLTADGGPMAGLLYFPPNAAINDGYRLDGSLNFTAVRGNRNPVESSGAVFLCSGADKSIIDTFHSNNLVWNGGTFVGEAGAARPRAGLQIGRRYLDNGIDPPSNPSSHHHRFTNMVFRGQWEWAPLYNYASEEAMFLGCHFNNEFSDPGAYSAILDGQSGVFVPESDFQPDGFGAYTGFGNNVFDKCLFWHTDATGGDTVTGPGIFISRAQGLEFRRCLTQVRDDATFVIYHKAAGDRGIQDLRIDCRAETSATTALIKFTGDDGGVHRGIEVRQDRLFAQRFFEADTGLSDAGVSLIDLHVRCRNVFPGSAALNPLSYSQMFANKAKFALVTGDIEIGTRLTPEVTFIDMRDFDVPKLHGRLKVSDRAQIGTLPVGNYRIEDDTDAPPREYTIDDNDAFTVQFEDSQGTPNVSPTTITAQVRRVGRRMTVFFKSTAAIDVTGMTGSDIFRIRMPRLSNISPFTIGHAILANLESPGTGGAGTIDQVELDIVGSISTATLKIVDAEGAFPGITVAMMDGASIRQFQISYNV